MLCVVKCTNKINDILRRRFEAFVYVNHVAGKASDTRRIGLDHFVGPVAWGTDCEVSLSKALPWSKLTAHKKGASPACGRAEIDALHLLAAMSKLVSSCTGIVA